jgi:hypothetical protein
MPDPALILILADGFFWTVAYVLIIIRSIRDKTYGMPVIACCMNLSWEFIYLFVYPDPSPQRIVNAVWLPLDLIILFLIIRFGPSENRKLTSEQFYLFITLCLTLSFLFMIYAHRNVIYAVTYTFAQNLIMSFLFISMLVGRRSIRGQSLYIALAKMLGTLSISLLLLFIFSANRANRTVTMITLYASVFALDIIYAGLIYRKIWKMGINPWARL